MTKYLGILTKPSKTQELSVSQYDTHLFGLVISNINTNIEIQFEYSYDKESWYNIDEKVTYIEEDGTYNFIISPDFNIDFIRLNWLSETGGTNTEIKVYYTSRN